MKFLAFTAAAVLIAMSPLAGHAQAYPNRPVKMVVPYPAGGGTDLLARLLARKLGERLGQPVVVENRTGASGKVGTDYVGQAAPDGYTLLFNNDTLVEAPSMSKGPPEDVLAHLAPLGLVAEGYMVIGASASTQAPSLAELVSLIKAEGGTFAYASCGSGTAMHLAGELFKQVAGIDMTHVPYRGCGPAVQAAAAGQVPVVLAALPVVAPFEKQGRIRILATTSAQRTAFYPRVPTIAESGYPGYEATTWQAAFAPAATPPPILARLSTEVAGIVRSADFRQHAAAMMFEARAMAPDELGAMMRKQERGWRKLVESANIKAD